MAFQQLYYTSCEHGLLGYGGFQFNAVTPGVSAAVLREVEDLTSYEPPRSMPGDPGPDQLASYPVAFSHSLGSAGTFITARVVFAGSDYSGRPGNYFAHALVTESAADFGSLLPAELWEAPLWRTAPAEVRELPPLPGPPPRGTLDPAGMQAFIDGRDPRVLPVLVTAAVRAMAGDRPVVLVGPDSAANAGWIAAVSYLLGEGLARKMSFTTYTHRPSYSGHHLIGVVPGGETVPADQGFHVYDAATGQLPEVAVHPLAALLARAGVLQAGSLWQQATALATSPAKEFDGWHAPVAAAAALHGMRLDVHDVDAVVTWLGVIQQLPPDAGRVLERLLDRQYEPFSDRRITDLHAVAGRLRSGAAMEQLELVLVERAYACLERAEPVGALIRLTSQPAKDEAARRCVDGLYALSPEVIPEVLRWTADAGVVLPAGEFRQYGQHLDPYIESRLLAEILDGRPEIVEGLVAMLAAHREVARDLFASPNVITREDLAGQPGLAELWLLGASARGDLSAFDAFNEISKLRLGNGAAADVDLLNELWPHGCPSDDLCRLLPAASDAGLTDWLVDPIIRALQTESGDSRVRLAQALNGYPDIRALLPVDLRKSADSLFKVAARLNDARARVARGETKALTELCHSYRHCGRQAQELLIKEIPGLLCQAKRLGPALRGCPGPVRRAFCQEIRARLKPYSAEPELAARVFLAMLELGDHGEAAAVQDLVNELEPVLDWPGGQRRVLRKALGKDGAAAFDQWREDCRGGGLVKFRGLLRRDGGRR